MTCLFLIGYPRPNYIAYLYYKLSIDHAVWMKCDAYSLCVDEKWSVSKYIPWCIKWWAFLDIIWHQSIIKVVEACIEKAQIVCEMYLQ
jgi:hypothetical protein